MFHFKLLKSPLLISFLSLNLLFLVPIALGVVPSPNKPSSVICNPPLSINDNDWKIKPETWGDGNVEKAKEDPQSIARQFKADVIIYFNTMFPSSKRQEELLSCKRTPSSPKLKNNICQNKQLLIEEDRQNFIKRLFLILADAPLKYTIKENDSEHLKVWPYPLAVVLSHGQRIIFDIDGMQNGNLFYNLILSGNLFVEPQIDTSRLGASHGFRALDSQGKTIIQEENLKGAKNLPKNLSLGLRGKHRGVNITLGGLGNPDKDGNEIAPEGFRYDAKTGEISSKIQHGHAYLQVANFGKNRAAMMVGVEGSMPCRNCTNMYGDAHTMKGGFVSSENLTSVMGGQKMKPLLANRGCPAPAVYGGMWIKVDKMYFKHIESLFQAVFSKSLEDQKVLFKKLLISNGLEAHNILRKEFPKLYDRE